MLYLIIGIVILIVVFSSGGRPQVESGTVYYSDWDDDDRDDPPAPADEPYFVLGRYYRWQQIGMLVWALGYSKAESQAMYTRGFVEVWRKGFHAEFDATLGKTDADGEPLFACHAWDTHADTEETDRWQRTPDARAVEVYRHAP